MLTLSSLKLVISKKHISVSPVLLRRNKIISKVQEQIDLCLARKDGVIYAPKHLKKYTDKITGEQKTIEVVKRVKEWYWINDVGKINLAIKYGSKTLLLNNKGANAIEVSNTEELITTLNNIKIAIENGELDTFIDDVSNSTKSGFSK